MKTFIFLILSYSVILGRKVNDYKAIDSSIVSIQSSLLCNKKIDITHISRINEISNVRKYYFYSRLNSFITQYNNVFDSLVVLDSVEKDNDTTLIKEFAKECNTKAKNDVLKTDKRLKHYIKLCSTEVHSNIELRTIQDQRIQQYDRRAFLIEQFYNIVADFRKLTSRYHYRKVKY